MKLRICIIALLSWIIILAVGATAEDTDEALPSAHVSAISHEFDPVPEGTTVTHPFAIQNQGRAPLVIEKVKTG